MVEVVEGVCACMQSQWGGEGGEGRRAVRGGGGRVLQRAGLGGATCSGWGVDGERWELACESHRHALHPKTLNPKPATHHHALVPKAVASLR